MCRKSYNPLGAGPAADVRVVVVVVVVDITYGILV